MEYLKKWDPMKGLEAQLILGFSFGIISSVFGSEGYIFILYYVILEIIFYFFSKNHNLFYRLGIVCSSLAGWVIGRTLSGADTIWNDI